VPVYLGGNAAEVVRRGIMPKSSFVDASVFTMSELAKELKAIASSPSRYATYFEWRKGKKLSQGFFKAKAADWTDLQCRLCNNIKTRVVQLAIKLQKSELSGSLPQHIDKYKDQSLREHLAALEHATAAASKCSRKSSSDIRLKVSVGEKTKEVVVSTEVFGTTSVLSETSDQNAPTFYHKYVLPAASKLKLHQMQGNESICNKGKARWFLMTYAAGEARIRSAGRYKQKAESYGSVDQVFVFGPQDIDPDFRSKNSHILNQTRGVGLWLWKSYVVRKVRRQIISVAINLTMYATNKNEVVLS
jgi:hypothetical protein